MWISPTTRFLATAVRLSGGGAPISRSSATGSDSTIPQLQDRVERLNLVVQTLLALLLEKKVIGEEEFQQWLDYVDELDGVKDGKLREDKRPIPCPSCQRNSPSHARKCSYCGAPLNPKPLAVQERGEPK